MKKKCIDKYVKEEYNNVIEDKEVKTLRQKKLPDVKDLQLTDDPLENIKLMAPYLDKEQQKAVYFVMFGMVSGSGMEKPEGEEEKVR